MTIALFTLLIAVLTQVLGASYNYQFFNALGIPLSVHPITLEDNIQTALSHLPSFIASIIAPTILGFAFRFHVPKAQSKAPPKNSKLIFRVLQQLFFPISVILLIVFAFIFLPTRTAQYVSGFICLFYLLNITFDKIENFSLKNDIAFSLFCLLYIVFFVVMYLYNGETDGYKFKTSSEAKYLLKVKTEHDEFISCSALRQFSSGIVCVRNGKIIILKKELVQEITVL
jgi:hypothetical protein